jgi:GH15 family glucan-1,4-alpha-glucosidase
LARIEDYALIGDTHTAALVSREGSIDWLCLPRFDAESCFAALLDAERGGRWRIAPEHDVRTVERAYREDSLVLETTFETARGTVALLDCMPLARGNPEDPRSIEPERSVLRVVKGISGQVPMSSEFGPRFDYGIVTPWLDADGETVVAAGGGDALDLRATVPLELDGPIVRTEFEVAAGNAVALIAAYRLAHENVRTEPSPSDWSQLVERTDEFWRGWAASCRYDGPRRDEVVRSLLTLKALTYSPTGGIVAAATTSLPEVIGGGRNWDYRYCWLRDATFALQILLQHGYKGEAREWHDWLLRAVGGDPEGLQVLYGITGERLLFENQVDALAGYEGSSPVRIGNGAAEQFQLDEYGEVMDLFQAARRGGIDSERAWQLQRDLVEFVERHWHEPDNGFWEMRAERQHFVHSKVMACVAVERALAAVREHGKEGPSERWERLRDEIRADVLARGYSEKRGCFVSWYGSDELDASLLRIPLVGFLPADDERVRTTIATVERELVEDGLVRRYRSDKVDDGLRAAEGVFLVCTFWLVRCLCLLGRHDDAEQLFARASRLRNDVGLLSEQYSLRRRRMVGNFPQALSHVALVAAARDLEAARGEGSGD